MKAKKIFIFLIFILALGLLIRCTVRSDNIGTRGFRSNKINLNVDVENAKKLNNVNYEFSSISHNNSKNVIKEETSYLDNLSSSLSKLSSDIILDNYNGENIVVSPISVYLSLILASYVGDDEIKNIIYDNFYLTDNDILHVKDLINSLLHLHEDAGRTSSYLDLANSIWLNEGLDASNDVLGSLANDLYCSVYQADFASKNTEANNAVRNYIKEKTNGLIDRSFNISKDTIFNLINTIYLKSLWNSDGGPLKQSTRQFLSNSTSLVDASFLTGDYKSGKVYESSDYSAFYTKSSGGYTLKFILPNEGKNITDVFTTENINNLNNTEYVTKDEELKERYHTRCIFPEFNATSDLEISKTLQEKYGLTKLFENFTSKLTNSTALVQGVNHVAKIDVNKYGIEAAAVTIIRYAGASGPDEYKDLYSDFILDRPFGYILTDTNGVILFSGICNTAGAN